MKAVSHPRLKAFLRKTALVGAADLGGVLAVGKLPATIHISCESPHSRVRNKKLEAARRGS